MNKIIECWKNNGDKGDKSDLFDCDYVQLELLGPHAKESNAHTLISKSSLEVVLNFSWYLSKDNYPTAYQSSDGKIKLGRGLKLHKLLNPNVQKGYVVDHINRNRLDNRMENFRICTQKQNSFNTTKSKNSKQNYKGVKKANKAEWSAVIQKDNQKFEINGIEDEKDAAVIYDLMAEELFGEYAGKNFGG